MKRLLMGTIMIGALVCRLAAQTDSSEAILARSSAAVVSSFVNPNVTWWGYPAHGWRTGRHGDKGFRDSGYAADPYFYKDVAPVPPGANAVVVPRPAERVMEPPEAPSPPVQSETREYRWPPSTNHSSATTFSIVSVDGRVQSATLVWVEGDTLSFITPDGSQVKMPVSSVDREATNWRNTEHHLTLRSPAHNSARLEQRSAPHSGGR
jgi:hypothetical protein